MNTADVLQVMREGMWVTLQVSAPFLLLALFVGLVISLIQAMTQLQEMTLSFVPKILLLFASTLVFGPWSISVLVEFTQRLMDRAVGLGVQ